MAKPSSQGNSEYLSERVTDPFEQLLLNSAEQITRRQHTLAKALLKAAKEKHYSEDLLIENICVLMASSFREGINLTLDTYGLGQQSLPLGLIQSKPSLSADSDAAVFALPNKASS